MKSLRLLLALLLVTTLAPCATDPAAESVLTALDRGDYKQAAELARRLVGERPRAAALLVLLAQAEIGSGDAGSALEHLQKALRLEPKNVDALYYVSKLAAIRSQQEFADVLRLDADGARAHQLSGDMLAAQNKTAEAEQEYMRALDKRPGLISVLISLGDLLRSDNKYETALDWYQKAIARDASNYDAVYGAGASLWFLKRVPEAEKLFRRALDIEPGSLAAKMALGEALLAGNKPQEAIRYLEPPAQADPNVRQLQFLLGRNYKALGRDDDAAKAFARYRQLTQQLGKQELDDLRRETKP